MPTQVEGLSQQLSALICVHHMYLTPNVTGLTVESSSRLGDRDRPEQKEVSTSIVEAAPSWTCCLCTRLIHEGLRETGGRADSKREEDDLLGARRICWAPA